MHGVSGHRVERRVFALRPLQLQVSYFLLGAATLLRVYPFVASLADSHAAAASVMYFNCCACCSETHLHCLKTPLLRPPSEDWHCVACEVRENECRLQGVTLFCLSVCRMCQCADSTVCGLCIQRVVGAKKRAPTPAESLVDHSAPQSRGAKRALGDAADDHSRGDEWFCMQQGHNSCLQNAFLPYDSCWCADAAAALLHSCSVAGEKRGRGAVPAPARPAFHDAVGLSNITVSQRCGVCKVLGGPAQLVACTFPGCSRAYHPVRSSVLYCAVLTCAVLC